MTNISLSDVEEWLDANPEGLADYFLQKADIHLINRWLVSRGYLSVGQPHGGLSDETSPVEKASGYSSDCSSEGGAQAKSRKALRQDFAKSKAKSVFRRNEPMSQSADTHMRRNSLKELHKFLSLPSRSIHILNMLIQSKVRLPRLPSKGLESKMELRLSNERQFFLESVQEIAHDLDERSLTQKIIVNLSILLDADGASLFLVEGPKSHPFLVSKVFDLHCGTDLLLPGAARDEIIVPWGKGIIGHVAQTGDVVNLNSACEDPRYNDEVDLIRGYKTRSLLCMPVRNADNDIIAVAQVINKNPQEEGSCFTYEDEKLFETYLEFCGIALTNAQLFELSRKEYERNRSLLEVVHDLFEEQTTLDKVILKIMQRGQRLLKCERAAVLLLQESIEDFETVKFTKTFDLTSPVAEDGSPEASLQKWADLQTSPGLLRIAERVACTGEVLNLQDPPEVQQGPGRQIQTLLCMPIRNRDYKIIGIAIIINRSDGLRFDENDEQLFEAFTLFCGLGINNTLMYSELERAMARQKVALEVISYHGASPIEEVSRFLDEPVPEAEALNLVSLTFDDFSLNSDEMILGSIRMFQDLGILSRFSVDYRTLCQFLCTVRKNYRQVPYHNWRHAFNVAQVMFAIFTNCELHCWLTDLEILGMIVGCLCHDLDHRGTNNAFQEKTGSALALLYGNKATMEHHHFNHAVMILSSEGHNIFSTLSSENYSKVVQILKHAILATDLSTYFQLRTTFFALVDSEELDWTIDDHKEILRSMLMTACDLGASTKPWYIQHKVAELVTSEFFDQGDKEKMQLKIQPQALMDRERKHELPQLQYRWIETICLPLYQTLTKLNSKFSEMADGAVANREKWAALATTGITNVRPKLTNGAADFFLKETGV